MNVEEKKKILIVDAEQEVADELFSNLQPLYSVTLVAQGRAAIHVAHDLLPDLILLETDLNDISGFETLIELKESDLTRGIPVIFISSNNDTESEERSFALGAVDYISKPFHPAIIQARIQMQLQMREYILTIERLGMIDALTNIPNRRSFDIQLRKEWERAVRESNCIGLMMMDIDDFKKYNDTYGHTQGDALLRAVARVFEQTLKRPADFVARWGGEEFVILLPNTDAEGSIAVAEQVREQVSKLVVPLNDGSPTRVTLSIGVNAMVPLRNSDMEEFVNGADKACYEAKRSGKNRVLHA
ncbi:MAG: diguanylate cyclase [Symbiobacteriaceae bacterium]|nr:diguanylate cyclase [Symbiobacteriaceae bacterium]